MTKLVSSTILLLFGVALLKLALSEDLLLYVKPSARPWVLLSGIALVLLAAWSLLSVFRGRDDDRPAQTDGHHAATPIGWFVLAPVIAALVIAPPALGAFTANRTAPRSITGNAHAPRPGTAPVALSMYEFYLLGDKQPASLSGRTITLTGFVAKHTAGGFVLARLVITCCAADAFSVPADVTTTSTAPPVNRWVRVTGTFAGTGKDRTPRIAAVSVVPIRQPAEPYDAP